MILFVRKGDMISWPHIGKTILRVGGGSLLLLAFYVPWLLSGIFPHRPRGVIGWLILMGIGVPASLALELSGSILNEKRGRAISSATFSAGRILIMLTFLSAILGALCAIGFFTWPHICEYFF